MRLLDERTYASLDQIRSVWAAVSEDPRVTLRQLSTKLGMSKTKINQIFHFLEAAGYIEHKRKCVGRRVLIPLVECPVVYAVKIPLNVEGIAPRSNLSQKPSGTIP